MPVTGTIFNIQRFSIHDGPGIRTTVFFKGCSLRCFWCHNPESWHHAPQIQVFPEKCIACGTCLRVCPNRAHSLKDGRKVFSRDRCKNCGTCAVNCFAGSLVKIGQTVANEEVMDLVELDRVFYAHSGGGVTFSGGEPMLQKDFLMALLIDSKKRGLHTAVDTSGDVPWDCFTAILPHTDLFLYDIKVMDPKRHADATGRDNKRILDNLTKLSHMDRRILARIPVVPGVNATIDEMKNIAAFVKTLPHVESVELLNYHRLGEAKYASLGMVSKAKDL
ncbi:MAG: glycyl-radical enzyme activating protein [Planctomycetota bacterium]